MADNQADVAVAAPVATGRGAVKRAKRQAKFVAAPEPIADAPVLADAPLSTGSSTVAIAAALAPVAIATAPVELPVAEAEAAIEDAPVVADELVAAAPEAEPVAPAPAEPAEFTPTAAVPADRSTEETTMETINTTAAPKADVQATLADFNSRAKQAMEKGSKMFEEMNAFGKGNVEALVESGKIAAKGFEAMSQEAAEFTRKSFEGASEAAKTLVATRSPTDYLKLHSDYTRSMFDAFVAQTSRSTEAMIKLANEVAQPISNRVALAAEKVKIAA